MATRDLLNKYAGRLKMGARTQKLIALAKKHLPRNYAPSDDFVLASGRGCWLRDVEGKAYLDMLACYSAANNGYANPKITRAVKKHLNNKGITCNANCFWEEEKILFARDLAEFCEEFIGPGLNVVLPMNSGAEAVETAMKIARKWGYAVKGIPLDQAEIIFCENNFHGRTIAIVSASSVPQYSKFFGPPVPGIKLVPFADIEALKKAINPNTAAFIVEPIQGEGGIIIPPDGYLAEVGDICADNRVLFVADEIQSGFGRTGKMFGCNHDGAFPHMIILGKALGGGLVISAVVGRKEVMSILEPGDHGSTFGGNPLSCAVARESLSIMREERLEKMAALLGEYFEAKLKEVAVESPHIQEIRVRGLWIAIEVRHDGPDAHEFCRELHKEGILCKETRDYTIRMSPPLIITRHELDFAVEKIRKVFCS